MNLKEDEDITIDFGKIKNFFSSKKEDKKEEQNKKDSPAEDAKKDDEIANPEEFSIDFSKVKSFFKNLFKSGETEKKEPQKEEGEEEFSFDLSRIKNIFKPSDKTGASEEELSINWNKVIDFFKKYSIVFIALIPILLSIYIRMQAGFLPMTDDWAANSVINGARSQVRASIDQQYPNLPDANKNALVDVELQKFVNQNKQQIDQQIKATSAYFKSFFQDENNKNYMPDIDPYYWFRYAKNIIDHGHPGDVLKEGAPFDNHQLAPIGRYIKADMFHAYFLAYFYKTLHFFAPDLALMRSMFYYPVFISALSVLLVFLIARRIAGNIGGFFAGLMMAINAAFLGRTLFGHADSDAWVVFFPLLVTWLFVETIEVKSILKVIILSIIAGIFTGLFTSAWGGWWFIFDFLLVTIAITFLYIVLIRFNDLRKNIKLLFYDTAIKNILVVGFVYFFSTAIFVTLFSGWSLFIGSFLGPLSFPAIKAPVSPWLWPNVLTTVAELNEGSISGIINSVGGPFLFFISLLGLILSIARKGGMKKFDFVYIICTAVFYVAYFVFRKWGISISVFGLLVWIMLPIFIKIAIVLYKKDESYDFKLPLLLSLWVVATIFASIKGIRFTLLLAPAFSVAFGVAFGNIYLYLSRWLTKELKIHKAIGSSILIVLLLLVYANPIRGSIGAAGSDMPIINDAWYNALIAIKQDSKENAIITSWWDFGHHFKALADRPVTFDGTTQIYPPAHWVGRLLMTSDETEAVGILRMLDCGNNNAFNTLYEITNDTHLALKLVNDIILLDKKDAEKKLKEYKLNENQTKTVLSFTHCEPPEAYFIASEDMIGKSGVWSHFGSWNFERADLWLNARKMSQEKAIEYMVNKFNYTKENAENIYFEMQSIASDSEANTWVAPWPGYAGTMSCSKNNNDIYVCSNGLQVNLSNHDVFGIGQQGIVRPRIAVFPTDDGILKREFEGNTIDLGMTIFSINEDELEAVLSSKELAGGMFTRMFYMQGHGLKYFKLFNHQRGLTGTNIYTYKVDWQGKNITIVDDYAKKPAKEENKESIIETPLAINNTNNLSKTTSS